MVKQKLPHVLCGVVAVAAALAGLLDPADNWLRDWRFKLSPRDASHSLAIVQIDSRSLNNIGVWPWSRTLHAQLLRDLTGAGVSDIAFDIDFSLASSANADAAFEAALAEAGGSVILAAFRQAQSSVGRSDTMDLTVPLKRFSTRAWPAHVNVSVGADGMVRDIDLTPLAGDPPIAAAVEMLAAVPLTSREPFLIDFSIRPEAIPRVSYADLIGGAVSPDILRGKKVIIGATAVELGDRFNVPVHGVISGPLLQAIGAESILQGRMLRATGPVPTIIGVALIGLLFMLLWRTVDWKRDAIMVLVLAAAVEVGAHLLQRFAPVSVDTAAWHFTLALYLAASLLREIDFRRVLVTLALDKGRNSELLLEQVMNDAFDGIIIAEYGGKVLSINPAARRIIGVGAAEEVSSRTLAQLLPAEFARAALPAVEDVRAQAGTPAFREIMLATAGDGAAYLELTVTRSVLRGEPGKMVVALTFSDVSERRRAEIMARRAAEEALSISRAKSAFLAGISHELRTPLNAIIGFSDMLRKEMMGPVGMPCYLEYAGHIHESGNQLLHLVNDVLDLTRFEAGELVIQDEPVDPGHILSGVAEMVSGWPEVRTRELSCQVLCENVLVRADARILRQSIVNLVSNAVKFTQPGGSISMLVCLTDAGELEFRVSDDGIGIAKDAIPDLTKPFYQADAQLTREQGGSGLGLAVVDSYVRAHGGRLAIDSTPGQGTSISIILPAERLTAVQASPDPQYARAGGW